MKDLSFFFLKNSLAAKMKKGIRSFCNGVGSTTTLDQRKADRDMSCVAAAPPSVAASSSFLDEGNTVAAAGSPLTLEQMILQLDMEEEVARRAKLDDDPYAYAYAYSDVHHRRMSCVHSSDILRSARNALNQYPRFSLDGRDAMYRSSFRNAGRRSARRPVGFSTGADSPFVEDCYYGQLGEPRRATSHGLPATVAGESVVWCKPGVVAQLMGLEAVPVPLGGKQCGKRKVVPAMGRKQSLRRMGRHELERERLAMGVHGQCRVARRESVGSCSGGGAGRRDYCVAPPPVCARPSRGRPDWRLGRAR
ncbi:hypothetical protein Taro_047378 [Colocasia esculenta]|uniref:DUF3741 domain-containing protein n=1 Tax=Colocasia esculenta TaxID=4460 RepID=A0A843WW12_COLES|nr:hypothetical protein [Colocasia esculenta]